MKRLWFYFIYLLLIWGSFRYFVKLPEVIEELWFKPLIWLLPLFWWNIALKKKIEMFENKWLETSLWGLGMGILYWVLVRRINFGLPLIDMNVFGIALATAVVEEMTFSGFIGGYIERFAKGSILNPILVGILAAIVRLPIIIFVYKLNPIAVLGVLLIVGASSMMNAWIRQRTGNVTGSIIARVGLNLALLG